MTVPKECPLCGGEARVSLTHRAPVKDYITGAETTKDTYTVSCIDCSCMVCRTGPKTSEATRRQVLAAWNKREGGGE